MSLRLMFHPERANGSLQVVTDNDSYFMTVTINKLDEQVDGLTPHTEQATYVDNMYYEDKDSNRLPWYKLSIGSKTVLNAFYNPDVCFSQVECDKRTCGNLKRLTQGCITPGFLYDLDGDDQCDVIIDDDDSLRFNSVSAIHNSGSDIQYTKGIFDIRLSFGFNMLTDTTSQQREMLLYGLKCYEDSPVIKHIATKQDYFRFLNMDMKEDCRNTIFFLDRFALFGNSEVIGKCRDIKHAAILIEATGFVDTTFIMPRVRAVIDNTTNVFKLYSKRQ